MDNTDVTPQVNSVDNTDVTPKVNSVDNTDVTPQVNSVNNTEEPTPANVASKRVRRKNPTNESRKERQRKVENGNFDYMTLFAEQLTRTFKVLVR